MEKPIEPRAETPSGRRPLHAKRRLAILSGAVFTYILAALLSRVPGVVESIYSNGLGPLISRPLSRLTGLVPFSLAEWCYVAYGAWLIALATIGIREISRRRRPLSNALLGGVLRVGRDVGVIVMLFYLLWGFNYSREPLETRMGWSDWENARLDELVTLSTELVDAGNDAYEAIHHRADAGEPTTLPISRSQLTRAVTSGWDVATREVPLPPVMARSYGPPKPLLSSALFARLGITGFYFPFTAEANVRRGLPALSLPQSIAHEQAHQRGVATEAEASFLGFVAGVSSDDPYVRYSSIVFAQGQLMNVLARAAPDEWRRLNQKRLAGVRRDLADLNAYFRRFEGVGTKVGETMNDSFLRANRVEGGVLNYGRAARLLIAFSRESGGKVLPSIN